MRVCLIDVDSKIPNLALMRASTWHKERGDEVKLGFSPIFDDPDLVYMSKMFDFTDEPRYLPLDADILRGGPDIRTSGRYGCPSTRRAASTTASCPTTISTVTSTPR